MNRERPVLEERTHCSVDAQKPKLLPRSQLSHLAPEKDSMQAHDITVEKMQSVHLVDI